MPASKISQPNDGAPMKPRSSGHPDSIGFIGLGRMGTPMAQNLVEAGFPVRVWSRTPAKAAAFAEAAGCTSETSLVSLAQASEVVVTMVSDGPALEEIYFDAPAFLQALKGGVALDMSTIGPASARAFAARLATEGVSFVEAPVSGSVAAAQAGSLAVLAGGTPKDLDRIEPLLAALGDPVLRVGEVGTGSTVKLAINLMIYGINQCLAEALVLAERGGVEPTLAYDAILASAAAAPVVGYRRDAFLAPEQTAVSFSLALEEKDLRLIEDLARELGSPAPQLAVNREIVQKAIAAGHENRDIAAVSQYLREATDA